MSKPLKLATDEAVDRRRTEAGARHFVECASEARSNEAGADAASHFHTLFKARKIAHKISEAAGSQLVRSPYLDLPLRTQAEALAAREARGARTVFGDSVTRWRGQ